ncbi:phosphoglycerate mutase family protein NDAI_0H00490 [Naumovozyma dairenensis CBS 421]|uniref:Phosphoglycerate mutase n=1 Tax=Naumovozyma dairenensis (strain ATCC 10597 / BCRC 20456 / CBS 421 / NBRC 0211 / NRRL Y-12639) TaxID=1071378 RepID=G0WEL2_NAUDC|nr:hypothetical protein NDAI_0H00490 [Naumovozyma dairenensis CBS 421]CCD26223.1 hypothetical protein NDAI_0H00490 [Naumovozyma dairenensis CBS 421]
MSEFKSLPKYFHAFPRYGSPPIDSQMDDPLKLNNVFNNNWKQLYESIPKEDEFYSYKLLIIGRHGQGYHNAATIRYGWNEWDKYWSMLQGDEFSNWVDSKLTPLGERQVQIIGETVLLPMIKQLGFLPHVFFSSPLRRCLETFIGSWGVVFGSYMGNDTNNDGSTRKHVNVEILENLRETLGKYTCNERVDRSVLLKEYQNFEMGNNNSSLCLKLDNDYPEVDRLWVTYPRESRSELDERIHKVLIELFSKITDEQRLISITCHAHVINSILRNLNHPPILNLETGKIVCTVVQVKKRTSPQKNL